MLDATLTAAAGVKEREKQFPLGSSQKVSANIRSLFEGFRVIANSSFQKPSGLRNAVKVTDGNGSGFSIRRKPGNHLRSNQYSA